MYKFSDNKPKASRPSQDNIKERLVSDLEILEIHDKINNEQDINTLLDTPSINKQKQSNRLRKIETPHNQATHNHTTQSKH